MPRRLNSADFDLPYPPGPDDHAPDLPPECPDCHGCAGEQHCLTCHGTGIDPASKR